MTMHRRPVGRARLLAAIGAAAAALGCLPRWWAVGGDDGLPELSGNGFDGFGILVFVVGLATIALVTLPYATDRPVSADRWPAYAILAAAGLLSFALRVLDLAAIGAFSFSEPVEVFTRGPGLWVAGIGLLALARASYDVYREPPLR
ncbi:MAG TPA: hypothetical protein VLS28_01155 [Candidatus Sulfomarinibacteraceae bacterium]|nr:hypothetical protein [Candidatus Sulfomarinibacteraceae bacterium]